MPYRRLLLAGASLVLGVCYGVVPLVPARWWLVDPLLVVAGASQAFFNPLHRLGAIALGLVGHSGLSRMMGMNQGWNHAGNLASALAAMALVSWISLSSVSAAVTFVSILGGRVGFSYPVPANWTNAERQGSPRTEMEERTPSASGSYFKTGV